MRTEFGEFMSDDFKKFPRGKLNEHDEGLLHMGVTVKGDVVIIAFPKEIAWIGMPAEQAEELAGLLVKRAKEARRNRM